MKDPLQSPAFPGDHCFRYRQIYRLSTHELVPSIIAGMDAEVVESEHVCITLEGSGGAGFLSGSICGGGD